MINYIEKGLHLHNKLLGMGYSITHVDGVPVVGKESGDVSQADIDMINSVVASFDALPYAQAEAITIIAEHANALIEARINPLKAKRIQADALSVTAKGAKGGNLNASDNAKLDRLTAQMAYPDAIFAAYDIEEAAILAATGWKAIDVAAALANLDAVT